MVTIPSNADAVVERAAALDIDPDEIRERLKAVEELAEEEEKRNQDEEHEKHKTYFEKKQPVNKASSVAMKKFYKKIFNEDPPEDEKEAWKRIADAVDAMEEESAQEEKPVVEEVPEAEVTTEGEKEEEEEPNKPTDQQLEEAPQEEQKASVQIPLEDVMRLPRSLTKAYIDAAVEASQRGVPLSELGNFIDSFGYSFLKDVSQSSNGQNKD